mmetsp:Transcript_13050/g.23804  ORF Transcript_13050/g.23804 Transcript_13050/m.23804 type:complete len:325 (+) Transcript_13050:310-1284(+)
MPDHGRVQRRPAGGEALLLGLVGAEDVPHVLRHAVAVVVRRAEAVLLHHPAGRKDDEVARSHARLQRLGREDREGRGVQMVEGDGVEGAEAREIVAVGGVVAVPRHHVEGGAVQRGLIKRTTELLDQRPRFLGIFVSSGRRLKVSGVGQAPRPHRAQVRQHKMPLEDLRNVPAARAVHEHLELYAALHDADLPRGHCQKAHLGLEPQGPSLRHDQQVSVGIAHRTSLHRAVAGIAMDGHAMPQLRATGTTERGPALQEVRGLLGSRERQRTPLQLVRDDVFAGEVGANQAAVGLLPFTMLARGHDAIQPHALVPCTRGGEAAAR